MPKPTPSYWWDFQDLDAGHGETAAVIVESDRKDYPVLACFPVPKGKSAEPQIAIAEKLIEDLKAGRIVL
jgi:hypothetical protein